MKKRLMSSFVLIATTLLVVALPAQARPPTQIGQTTIFINEIHYDNAGTDVGEAIEIAGPAGTDVTNWSIVLYNGANRLVYDTDVLSGSLPDQGNGFGTTVLSYPTNGIQNGSPDGIALVDPGGAVVQFLSYEGSFVAQDGPAFGLTSTDIGVAEPSDTPVGDSLQLTGTGSVYEDFTWSGPAANTFGAINAGQTFVGGPTNSPIITSCGGPLALVQGAGGSREVTASDQDGTVTGISLVSVVPDTPDISLTNVTPAGGVGGTATATIEISPSLAPGSYAVTVGFSNDDAQPQTAECTVNVTVILSVPIYEIQGTGQFSPYNGQVVATSGVVTLFTANGAHCWLQDPAGDGNPASSDGIFVSGCAFPTEGPKPSVGDSIRIIAQVQEQQFGNALPLTRLRNVAFIEVLSSANPLPAPVPLVDLPDLSIPEGELFWEPLEGMRVSVDNAPVSSATNGFGEFGMLAKNDAKPDSGFFADTQHILVRNLGGDQVDYNPERIMVDDSSLVEAIYVQPGDRVRSLVGVVDYTFSMYKLQPEPGGYDIMTHNLPNLPASTRSGGFGNATITTFNVENLFDDFADPNDGKDDEGSTLTTQELDTKLAKLALAIQYELELPEILVVQEVENATVLQSLGDRVNMAAGTDYMAVSFETSDVRGIEVAFLWDAGRVTWLNAFQLDDTIVPGVSDAFGPTSPSPGREPIVGVFEIDGYEVTIVGNHFKSKSGDDPLYGVNWPPIRVTEVQRKAQAQVVRDYVNILLNADPDTLLMVAGDLNDFQFSEPGEGPDNPVAILEGIYDGVPLTSLLNFEKPAEAWTFVFDGNAQVLDHILVSPALLDYFRGADVLHFNTNTPTLALEGNASTPFSSSDHDPLESRFQFK